MIMIEELRESDLTTEELIDIKNIMMRAIRDSKYCGRFSSHSLNLVECCKYALASSVLALELKKADAALSILREAFDKTSKMVSWHYAQRGLE